MVRRAWRITVAVALATAPAAVPAAPARVLAVAHASIPAAGPAVERDVPYVAGGGPDQVLDLYVPFATAFPTVVFIHGGSLQEDGERRTSPVYAKVCDPFVGAGVGCATIDYRLAPTNKWPAMPADAAAAVKWVKTHIGARGGDPGRIFVFGHSSGCQIAAVLGANPKYLAGVGLSPSDLAGVIPMGCVLAPMEEATTAHSIEELRAMWPRHYGYDVSAYGSFDDRLDSDPSRFIGQHMPPTLVVVAEAERFFPSILEQGAKFVRRLLELKRPADLVIVPGRHMTSIQNIRASGDPTFAAIKHFIDDPAATGTGASTRED
jgi:acetyl esterase/lipase